MTLPRLAGFIRDNMEPILQAWEDFARIIERVSMTSSKAGNFIVTIPRWQNGQAPADMTAGPP